MRIGWGVLAMVATAMIAASAPAQTPAQMPAPTQTAIPDNAPHHVVTIVETGAPDAAKAIPMLQALVASSRREDGNAGYAVLHERGHPGRFAIIESWSNKAALDRHDAAAKAAEDKLQPLLVAPSDRRVCAGLDVAAAQAGGEAAGVYVMTHVDVVPPQKDAAIALLNELASASRKESGVQRFDIWQQASRPNHSYVIEVWRDDAARDMHVMADHTRAYRAKLLPLEGSLYDERVYEPVQ
ncbi:MAG: putative quinol monooxygenase [Alphaproteobacteria bacterium]